MKKRISIFFVSLAILATMALPISASALKPSWEVYGDYVRDGCLQTYCDHYSMDAFNQITVYRTLGARYCGYNGNNN